MACRRLLPWIDSPPRPPLPCGPPNAVTEKRTNMSILSGKTLDFSACLHLRLLLLFHTTTTPNQFPTNMTSAWGSSAFEGRGRKRRKKRRLSCLPACLLSKSSTRRRDVTRLENVLPMCGGERSVFFESLFLCVTTAHEPRGAVVHCLGVLCLPLHLLHHLAPLAHNHHDVIRAAACPRQQQVEEPAAVGLCVSLPAFPPRYHQQCHGHGRHQSRHRPRNRTRVPSPDPDGLPRAALKGVRAAREEARHPEVLRNEACTHAALSVPFPEQRTPDITRSCLRAGRPCGQRSAGAAG